jgi:hypothetical protein
MSRPELILESRAALVQAGVGNHSRASFICEITAEVIGSANPIYAQLQPKVLDRSAEAWKRAYGLVYQFLNEHELGITIRTCALESAEPPRLESDQSTADEQFSDLLEVAPERVPLEQKLRLRKAKRPHPEGRAGQHLIDFATLDHSGSPARDATPQQQQRKATIPVKRRPSAKMTRKSKQHIQTDFEPSKFPADEHRTRKRK